MTVMTIDAETLLGILTEIGRNRALEDHETDLIEEIVMLGTQPFKWTPRLDTGLQIASHSVGGIARFARRHDITPMAAYCRLHRIRQDKSRKSRKGAVEQAMA